MIRCFAPSSYMLVTNNCRAGQGLARSLVTLHHSLPRTHHLQLLKHPLTNASHALVLSQVHGLCEPGFAPGLFIKVSCQSFSLSIFSLFEGDSISPDIYFVFWPLSQASHLPESCRMQFCIDSRKFSQYSGL